jgi:hypothetical protein
MPPAGYLLSATMPPVEAAEQCPGVSNDIIQSNKVVDEGEATAGLE